jgi:hypothetical protein
MKQQATCPYHELSITWQAKPQGWVVVVAASSGEMVEKQE